MHNITHNFASYDVFILSKSAIDIHGKFAYYFILISYRMLSCTVYNDLFIEIDSII